jgi:catechol 2,3-dioxygenase
MRDIIVHGEFDSGASGNIYTRMTHAVDTSDATATASKLPATLRLGPVHLTVTDLPRAVAFYERGIGLQLHRREDGEAAMGAGGEDLLVLVEEPNARPPGRHSGLYHYALLHPSRLELARAVQRLLTTRTPISGASDHGISEAIYLSDPDGNGIELAADRPRERWGDLRDPATIGPRPLDMEGLLSLVAHEEPRAQADRALVVGHVHLHVGDIERGVAFYCDVVGFEVMTRFPSAAFVSAGGYHHHLAFNTWRVEGIPPAPLDVVGLRHWTVVLEDESQIADVLAKLDSAGIDHEDREGGVFVRDPWNIALLFTAKPPAGA